MHAVEGHRQVVALDLVGVAAGLAVALLDDEGGLRLGTAEGAGGVERVDRRQAECSARAEDPPDLTHRAIHVVDVLQAHEGDDEVGRPAREGQRRGVALDHGELRRRLAGGAGHRPSRVEADDAVPALREVTQQAPLATADVDGEPAGRRHETEEGVAVEPPVRIVAGPPRPAHPVGRLLLPEVAKRWRPGGVGTHRRHSTTEATVSPDSDDRSVADVRFSLREVHLQRS